MPDFTPCSSNHNSCSRFHANLVRGYIEERQRQELAFEELAGAYSGDELHAKAKGHTMINFHRWLKAHGGQRD